MISDFSGILFDYALVFDRPVIYVESEFDPAQYDAYWVKQKIWIFDILHEIGVPLSRNDFGNMIKIIDDMTYNPSFARGWEKARAESWAHIGHGSEQVVDYLVNAFASIEYKLTFPESEEPQ